MRGKAVVAAGAAIILMVTGITLTLAVSSAPPAEATGSTSGSSLWYHGNGVSDIDRVKIQVDDPTNSNPGPPADVGSTDFTIEFWMKAFSGDNTSGAVGCGANVNWINGNIVIDRDRYNQDRKFGLSIAGGKLVWGVSGDGTGDFTVCGTKNVLDGTWHHVAVQRRLSDGWMWIWTDGILDAQGDGPGGDVSYPDNGVPGSFCGGPCTNSDPYLVIGAEKHDAGSAFPSYSGKVDEVRLSNALRYASSFVKPSQPFSTDANTVGLYHFDEGIGNVIYDSSGAPGGPSNGERKYGGAPAGPEWTTHSPFSSVAKCDPRPTAPASTSYLAEGASTGGFETWVLVSNPGDAPVQACLTFLTGNGVVPGPVVALPAKSRRSVKVSSWVQTYDVSTVVEGIDGPVYAERSLISAVHGMKGTHVGKGVAITDTQWFLPEGATEKGFETWILVANPSSSVTATVTVEYLTSTDTIPAIESPFQLGPGKRRSIRVGNTITSYDVSTMVKSTGTGVIAERATYVNTKTLRGATDSPGTPGLAYSWYLAEGATMGNFETWVLVANPSVTETAGVQLTYFTSNGRVYGPAFNLGPGLRKSIRVDDTVPADFNVSTQVTSTAAPVVAERAMYNNDPTLGQGAATGEGVKDAGIDWLLVEGATDGGYTTWVLVGNPGDVTATVSIDFYKVDGQVAGPQDQKIPPKSRRSFKANDWVTSFDVSTRVKVTSGSEVIVERATYTPPIPYKDSTAGPGFKLA